MADPIRLGIDLQQKLELRLTPQLLQSLEILQLAALELQTIIKQELEANPTIEIKEEAESPEVTEKDKKSSESTEAAEATLLQLIEQQRESPKTGGFFSRPQSDSDKRLELLQSIPDKLQTLQDYLFQQFNLLPDTEPHRSLAENIIYNIDDSGYLKVPVEEIAQVNNTSVEEVKGILEIVQRLGPTGVGAKDLPECLLLQLTEDDPHRELKTRLITSYLEQLNLNKFPAVAKEVAISLEELKQLVNEIRSLNPHPGAAFAGSHAPYIMPDIIIENIDGRYEIKFNTTYIPQLIISRYYQELLLSDKIAPDVKDFIKKKIESANRLKLAIRFRQETIARIAREIVKIQKDFLEKGINYLKPLGMQGMAKKIGVHLATISRAVANKYIQTPHGIFPMKFFFSRPSPSHSSELQSISSLRNTINELINQEDKKRPLTDSQMVKILKKKGVDIARRTVAKYRDILKVPPAHLRKQH